MAPLPRLDVSVQRISLRPRALKIIAGVVAVVALATSGFAVLHRHTGRATGVSWSVTKKPFRLTFTSGGKVLTSETANGSGPAQRLGFLAAGVAHTVTDVVSSQDVAGGKKYIVATDEPGRRANVVVTHGRSGTQVHVGFVPSSGVDAVFDSFTAAPQEHFLGGRRRTATSSTCAATSSR